MHGLGSKYTFFCCVFLYGGLREIHFLPYVLPFRASSVRLSGSVLVEVLEELKDYRLGHAVGCNTALL